MGRLLENKQTFKFYGLSLTLTTFNFSLRHQNSRNDFQNSECNSRHIIVNLTL